MPPESKPKFSKVAILAFVLSVLSFIFFLFTAIPAMIFGSISIHKIKKSDGLRGKRLAIAGIIISTIITLGFMLGSFDARPIEQDYTTDDFISANSKFDKSYDLLQRLSYEGRCPPDDAPIIGLTESDIAVIEKVASVIRHGNSSQISEMLELNADAIEEAWQNSHKGRAIIEALNAYAELADLTCPSLDSDQINFLHNLRYLAQLYRAYVYVRTNQGHAQQALTELTQVNSVFRKLSINARSTATKLLCYAGISLCIDAANFIVNDPRTRNETIESLTRHFAPLEECHISLYNPVIFEYLSGKRQLGKLIASYRYTPCFMPNSTLRMHKNFYAFWINRTGLSLCSKSQELNVWPPIYPRCLPALKANGHPTRLYQCYNMLGSTLVKILEPVWDQMPEIKKRVEIKDDIFQFIMGTKLGKEVKIPRKRSGGCGYTVCDFY